TLIELTSCVTRRRPPLSPKFDHVAGGAKPSRAATPSSGAGIISANILHGNAVDRTPIISGGSDEVVGKVRMRLGPISLPKLKPTRAEGQKRLISPPRRRGRAASAVRRGRARVSVR